MNSPTEWFDELHALAEAAIEGRLTVEQRDRLERLVLEQPEARRFYVQYLHEHACLHWSAADPTSLPPARPTREAPFRSPGQKRRWLPWAVGLAAAVMLIAVGGYGLWPGTTPAATYIATLAEGKACKWDGGSLPTEVGARLAAGRLRLAEGLARIVFDSGAEVNLEGPADLELHSPQRCVLHAGRLIAKVPHAATGFTVDTPTAVLKDLGTEFGVHVKDEQTADVQVFDGQVDARHRASGRTEHMRTGKSLRFGPDGVAAFDPLAEKPVGTSPLPPGAGDAALVVHISTAMGRGKDAYVQPLFPPPKHSSEIFLLVKNTLPEKADWDRKAYVGLDLTPIAGLKVLDAQLSFTFAPTGMGFASEVPDATFAVYGLTDEALDDWDEHTLRWHNAPANRPGGAALDLAKVVRLGTFHIGQGVSSGTRSITGQALADFLNRDTNGLTTFILVRETVGSGRNDLVHGFANKNHPQLPPPTLKLTVAPRRS